MAQGMDVGPGRIMQVPEESREPRIGDQVTRLIEGLNTLEEMIKVHKERVGSILRPELKASSDKISDGDIVMASGNSDFYHQLSSIAGRLERSINDIAAITHRLDM